MTKDKALHKFLEGFGIPAYPSTSVPDDAKYPWLTYEPYFGGFGDEAFSTLHLYYYTDSEAIPNAKAEEICEAIRHGGVQVPYDGGTIWITTSSPEWFSVGNEDGSSDLKHRIINISLKY